jgi:hypothetical protein
LPSNTHLSARMCVETKTLPLVFLNCFAYILVMFD